ncbi:nuclease-related domain-containing protein [Sulfurovum sp. ST-21]|uniref:NERD domain-containing protein n=1 Tax=Sulfurovum indicum TaxID=2779528 RepID=A0A7M1S5U0_9BACT|nr:nuclease-related domain-containing protein [Sulfurovum indicum]QOR62728.1 NERD domain-containing protein [Sulfurovum indicum]
MIIKTTDPKDSKDKLIQAGYSAEKQMSFYLKRAFENSQNVLIINDLRLVNNDDVAPIDHFVIHECGFIIIESKSVSTKVSVNKYGEWKRVFANEEKGMPSPIQQAKRQALFLKSYLNKYGLNLFRDTLISKLIKHTYDDLFFDVLIAISDNGIIERDDINLPEVHKADAIPDKINELISRRKKNVITEIIPKHIILYHGTQQKIAYFLKEQHTLNKPLQVSKQNSISLENNSINEDALHYDKLKPHTYRCKKCDNQSLEIRYGKYGYYFKCLNCDSNMPIKHTCNKPSCKPRTKKNKNHFYKVCESCGVKELFFVNTNSKQ